MSDSADYDAPEFRLLMRRACNDPGSFVRRVTRSTNGPETMVEWQDRALIAAIDEWKTHVFPSGKADQ